MAGIDWSATGSMVGGIGSIIAVAVAIGLSEVQHRRTIRLVREQDEKAATERSHESTVLAIWVAYTLIDLRVKANAAAKPYGSIQFDTSKMHYPAEDASRLAALLGGFPMRYDVISPRVLDALPRFPVNLSELVIPVLRRTRNYDLLNAELITLAGTGQLLMGSLAKGVKRQAQRLFEIQQDCDKAYNMFAEHYGLKNLQQQLAEIKPEPQISTNN